MFGGQYKWCNGDFKQCPTPFDTTNLFLQGSISYDIGDDPTYKLLIGCCESQLHDLFKHQNQKGFFLFLFLW
jgi:hypothetical protein